MCTCINGEKNGEYKLYRRGGQLISLIFYLLKLTINKMAEVRKIYYSIGELKEEYFEINDKKEGEYLSYH